MNHPNECKWGLMLLVVRDETSDIELYEYEYVASQIHSCFEFFESLSTKICDTTSEVEWQRNRKPDSFI